MLALGEVLHLGGGPPKRRYEMSKKGGNRTKATPKTPMVNKGPKKK
jgi:hypothetical protein